MTRPTPSLVERIVEVLTPFAAFASIYDTLVNPSGAILVGGDDGARVTVADLRAARALLADLKSAPPEEGEREKIVKLLADKNYLRPLADYVVRGHLSYYGQLKARDGGLIDEILKARKPEEGR